MVQEVQSVKEQLGESWRPVCEAFALPYSSLMRWKSRIRDGEEAVGRPGPAKTEPLELATLTDEIRALAHGAERTCGTGALYRKYRGQISRRDLQALVGQVRCELEAKKEAVERRIEWRKPGLVWSMDDAQLERLPGGHGHVHVVHDLGSRYTLGSLGSRELADGPTVARNLEALFLQHGAPLFLKRDNGSNLNHGAVLEVMGEYGVIPLNSPVHYPPYNGAVERKQLELQRHLHGRLGDARVELRVFELEMEVSGHDLNHKRRRSLGGVTACRALSDSDGAVRCFGLRERREVYEEILALAVDITEGLREHDEKVAGETAFRYAAETWMQRNNVIQVTRNGEVLPCFYQIQSH